MGKLITYISILSMALLLFYVGGLIQNTPSYYLLNLLLHPDQIKSSDLWLTLFTTIGIGVGAAITIGFLSPGRAVSAAKTGFAVVIMVNVVWDLLVVWQRVGDDLGYTLASLVVAPLFIIGILTAIEWWDSRD